MVAVTRVEDARSVPRARLADRFRAVTDENLTTSAGHVLALKR